MTRSRFDGQIAHLNEELVTMGDLCEQAIATASEALDAGDARLASEVRVIDEEIDRKERDIEALCLKMLLQQQPVARDLRQISAALKMITDMERIGDQAEDIAEIVKYLEGRTAEEHVHIREMAAAASKMVTGAVDAYVAGDAGLAMEVIAADDEVDRYFDEVRRGLIGVVVENPADGEFALDLLMIAKYFERIGDHATNIAEWVLFPSRESTKARPAKPPAPRRGGV